LLGGLELPKLNFDIAIPEFPNPFKGLKEKLGELKEGTIEYFELEELITAENNKQLDAKNKIVETNGQIKKSVEQLTEAEKKAKENAEEIEETFRKIGESVRNDLVSNLREAIKGSQSFGQAINKVLDRMKDKLLDLALNKAISSLGNALSGGKGFTGFLGGLFSGKKERGGSVSAGGAYVVGERGPEILQMGSKGGNIIPNSEIGGGSTVTNIVNVSVDASGSAVQGDNANAAQLGQTIANVVKEVIIDEQRSGGLLT
jgi:phage-related minor tail protein